MSAQLYITAMGLFDRLRGDDERVVFLGIDGVPLDLVEDHPDVFENLTAIGETGSAGRVNSLRYGGPRLL